MLARQPARPGALQHVHWPGERDQPANRMASLWRRTNDVNAVFGAHHCEDAEGKSVFFLSGSRREGGRRTCVPDTTVVHRLTLGKTLPSVLSKRGSDGPCTLSTTGRDPPRVFPSPENQARFPTIFFLHRQMQISPSSGAPPDRDPC